MIRDSRICVATTWMIATWAMSFAVCLALWGEKITSKQWRYLFQVPGGQWSWAALFGAAAIILAVALNHPRAYQLRAAALAVIGTGCLAIAAFYATAPLIVDPRLVTFGSFPWLLCGGVAYLGAVVHWHPVTWC